MPRDRLLLLAMRLTSKLRMVHDNGEYQAVWETNQNHNGPYRGPQYVDELEAVEKEIELRINRGD